MTHNDSRRGMVLVTVLWSISLLSALAMAASVTFRSFAGVMAVERDQVQAEALLTAGLETAASIMQTSSDDPLTEVETTATLGTGAVRVRLNDEGGRIDIGKAPVEVLASMFRSIGVPDRAAGTLAQRIVERRSAGNAARPGDAASPGNPASPNNSAGPDNTASSDKAASPDNEGRPSNQASQLSVTNQPFADIGQLHSIPDMEPDWVEAIAPLTTVFGEQTVNPLTAPQAVIAALPGVDAQRAGEFIKARRNSPSDTDRLVRLLGPAQKYLAVKSQRVASVDLTAELMNGYATRAHAVIVVLPQDSQPYRVLIWTPIPYAKASIWGRPMARR